jgi:thiosulfate/3-mercaptopyruvate sulfurtransferase
MSRMRAMGVGDGHQVVVYDGVGVFSAARVWWNFRLMGKTDVAVLNGGLPKWKAEGREVEDMPPILRDRHMTAQRQAHLVKDVTQVASASKLGDWQILDARSPARFKGEEAEFRPGLRSGHIPGAINVHYATLLNDDKTMKEGDALRAVFEAAGADVSKRTITSCGSGVTAAILMLALERLGNKDVSLYDGSWSEWGQFEQLKVETG